jgi:hypothetical protein
MKRQRTNQAKRQEWQRINGKSWSKNGPVG